MTHIARGLDSDGVLLLDIVVNGHILQLPTGVDILIKVLEGCCCFFYCIYYNTHPSVTSILFRLSGAKSRWKASFYNTTTVLLLHCVVE